MRFWYRYVCAFCLALLTVPLGAQELDPEAPSSYFDVMPIHSEDQPIRELLDRMQLECTKIERRCPPGRELLERLFQGSYRDELPDFIVELRRDEESGRLKARQPILMFERRNTPYLMGVEQITAVIFSPQPVPMKSRLTAISEKDVNPFAGLMGVFGVAAGERTPVSETAVNATEVNWRRLSFDDAEDGLFIGTATLTLKEEAISRLTLIPTGSETTGSNQADFQSITGHLSNSRASFSAFSIGLGATFGTDDTGLANEGDPLFNAYALAKFYFPSRRPRLEVSPGKSRLYKRSIGVVVGTNVTNDPFSEIVLGLSIGHLIGKAGLIVAGNAIESSADDSGREIRLLVGVDYTF